MTGATKISLESWKCNTCGRLFGDGPVSQELAELCCRVSHCPTCGGTAGTGHDRLCYDCAEKKALAEAEIVEGYEGPLYTPFLTSHNEGFFETADDLIEALRDEFGETIPAEACFAHTCKRVPVTISIDRLIDQLGDEHSDAAMESLNGEEALAKAIDDFNVANAGCESWLADEDKKVKLDVAATA
jgi:hypothetical protein